MQSVKAYWAARGRPTGIVAGTMSGRGPQRRPCSVAGAVGGAAGPVRPGGARRHARAFVRGLLADRPRKNCWTIAEHAGDPTPDGMQHLHALAPLGVTLAHYALLLASPRRLEIVAPHVTDSWAVSSRV
jgi:hypothetical protein